MSKSRWSAATAAYALVMLAPVAPASASAQGAPVARPAAVAQPAPVSLAAPIVTRHVGTFGGRRVDYDAVVEPIAVDGADGRPAARLVGISYVARGSVARGKADPKRPVLFVFNGGPIVASSTLHMGAFGPRRVAIPDDISAPASSFRLVDNVYAPLDFADVVFFDPAGTGYSRVADGVDPRSQFSVVADARQLAQFVMSWSRLHGRTASPKFLVGESYGTIRAPEAAAQLQDAGMPLDGVVLLGQAVNIIEYSQRRANILSYVVSLPTMAANAWAHDRAERKGRTFERFVADARAFADGDYLTVLYLGDRAAEDRRRAAAARLQEFTGLRASLWLDRALKITKVEYQRLLIPGMVLSTNDARYAAPEGAGPDAGFGVVGHAYGEQFARYLDGELKAGGVGRYIDAFDPGGFNAWDWGPAKSPFGDWPYGQRLSHVFAANPAFRMLVGNGYYDTQTTVGAMDLMVAQSGWPRDRVHTAYYQGGHMAYTVEATLAQFMRDVRSLVTGAPADASPDGGAATRSGAQ